MFKIMDIDDETYPVYKLNLNKNSFANCVRRFENNETKSYTKQNIFRLLLLLKWTVI